MREILLIDELCINKLAEMHNVDVCCTAPAGNKSTKNIQEHPYQDFTEHSSIL